MNTFDFHSKKNKTINATSTSAEPTTPAPTTTPAATVQAPVATPAFSFGSKTEEKPAAHPKPTFAFCDGAAAVKPTETTKGRLYLTFLIVEVF